MLDFKGFTEREVQDLIDWELTMKQMDEMMWKINAQEIIRKVVMDTLEIKSPQKQEKK